MDSAKLNKNLAKMRKNACFKPNFFETPRHHKEQPKFAEPTLVTEYKEKEETRRKARLEQAVNTGTTAA